MSKKQLSNITLDPSITNKTGKSLTNMSDEQKKRFIDSPILVYDASGLQIGFIQFEDFVKANQAVLRRSLQAVTYQ
jgi:ABC-type metal ion transport system substrate-binding protein